MVQHIVLAYSGGLDTSVMVHWLKHHHNAKVTAALVDLGQDAASIEAAKSRALANGAEGFMVLPAADAFAGEYLKAAVQANLLYQGQYPLATALARPLIALKLVEAARAVGADAVAHGCTGKGNDQARIDAGVRALAPDLTILAPQRSHPMTRPQAIAYAHEHGLELPPIKKGTFSIDENLWGRSAEGDVLEDPAQAVPEAAYGWTASPFDAPDEPGIVSIGFESGIPVTLDGHPVPLGLMAAKLNEFLGAHGVGRIDHVEDRLVGIKSREVYEAPAAVGILKAKAALEALTLTRDELLWKPQVEAQYAKMVYDGQWFSPLRAALHAFVDQIQQPVTGTVKLQAYKGNLTVLSRQAPNSLYDEGLATYDDGDAFCHQDAEGFLKLHNLPLETVARVRGPPVPIATAVQVKL